ncbi:MAG: hypothetical protein PHD61_05550 [Bacteroidales bacterium]|nr:hypothetical protein [Bacteroidales bacterium]
MGVRNLSSLYPLAPSPTREKGNFRKKVRNKRVSLPEQTIPNLQHLVNIRITFNVFL